MINSKTLLKKTFVERTTISPFNTVYRYPAVSFLLWKIGDDLANQTLTASCFTEWRNLKKDTTINEKTCNNWKRELSGNKWFCQFLHTSYDNFSLVISHPHFLDPSRTVSNLQSHRTSRLWRKRKRKDDSYNTILRRRWKHVFHVDVC
jgi:hypothetical protein